MCCVPPDAECIERNAREEEEDARIWPLHAACRKGNIKDVMRFVENGTDVNAIDYLNWTPLALASRDGNTAIVKLLLSSGAEVNKRDLFNPTALYCACQRDHLEIVKILLNNHADANIDTPYDGPLHQACINRNLDIVRVLLENHADANAGDNRGETPLHMSCRYVNVVKLLLFYGADPNKGERHEKTPLYIAYKYGETDVVKALLDGKADVHVTDRNGWTPLHVACRFGCWTVVDVLLAVGADINALTNQSETPLQVACVYDQTRIVMMLLERGADPNFTMYFSVNSPLAWTCCKENLDVIKALLLHGALFDASSVLTEKLAKVMKVHPHTWLVNQLKPTFDAFCCGMHERLGAASPVSMACSYLAEKICKLSAPAFETYEMEPPVPKKPKK